MSEIIEILLALVIYDIFKAIINYKSKPNTPPKERKTFKQRIDEKMKS